MQNVSSTKNQFSRFKDILRIGVKYKFDHFLEHKYHSKTTVPDPVMVRRALEELGGTFIKLGQLLSLRPDLIPQEYCEELTKLQDHVEPFSLAEAQAILASELKEKAQLVTLKKLIASASIGQVYLADIKGEQVAIKIMRPKIEQSIAADLALLYHVAKILKSQLKTSIIEPLEIYNQFKLYTENELDYLAEAHNIERFFQNFLKTGIIIPHVHWHFTTRRVLTMEYIDGKPLLENKLSPDQKHYVVKETYNAMLKQIFVDGFFHADPHPGNILFTHKGKIAFIDFGIVGRLSPQLKKELSDLFVAMINKDVDKMMDTFHNLNLTPGTVDRETLRFDLIKLLGKYYDAEIKTVHVGELIMQSIVVAKKNNIKLPKDYVLLGKALLTLEGVCTRILPSFNLVEESKPFVRHLISQHMNPKELLVFFKKQTPLFVKFMTQIPERTSYFLSEFHEMDDRLRGMDKELVQIRSSINQGANRVVMGIVIGALLISFALVYSLDKLVAFVMLGIALILLIDYVVTSWHHKQ
jgi:ubiquinone biosynthesis protein